MKILKKIPLSVMYFTYFSLMQLTSWIPLKYWHAKSAGDFNDTEIVLKWAECYELIQNEVFQDPNVCGAGAIYSKTTLALLGQFGITQAFNQALGFVLLGLLSISLAKIVNEFEGPRRKFLSLFVLTAPPILLIAERANFDILILSCVLLSLHLAQNNHKLIAFFPLALSSLLKFYTAPLLILHLYFLRREKVKYLVIPFISLTLAVVYFDLRLIQKPFPSDFGWKFGIGVWTRYLSQVGLNSLPQVTHIFVGTVVFMLIIMTTHRILIKYGINHVELVEVSYAKRKVFTMLLLTHITCFMSGMSFDYRLVFIIAASIYYLSFLVETKNNLERFAVWILLLIGSWLSYPSPGLEPIGDLSVEILTALLLIRCTQLGMTHLRTQYVSK